MAKGFASTTDMAEKKITFSELAPVLETLVWLRKERRTWLEITNLMIPGLNDDPAETRKLAEWVGAELGDDVPLHFTAFHPDFKMLDRPRTPSETLTRARAIAREVGLKYVYTGNVHDPAGQTTFCPKCDAAVISRDWYVVDPIGLSDGKCKSCGYTIAGVFTTAQPTLGRRKSLGLVY